MTMTAPRIIIVVCCFLFFQQWSFAERIFDDIVFTEDKCKELGYATDFDVCAVIEFCTSDDDNRKLLLLDDTDNEEVLLNTNQGEVPLLYTSDSTGNRRATSQQQQQSNDEVSELFHTEVVEAEIEQAHKATQLDHHNHEQDYKEEAASDISKNDTESQDQSPQQRPPASHNSDTAIASSQQEHVNENSSTHSTTTTPPPNHAEYGWRLEGSTTCSYPGPIMRLTRGSNHGLFVRGADGVKTNLHFHGLHVAGASHANGDDLHRSVEGRDNTMIYGLSMPADQHHGGTHWYHSHLHGASWDQVKGGAFGMIVVSDNGHDVGTDDEDVLDFLNHRERIMILDNSHNTKMWRTNGLEEESHDFVKDEWYRLRILAVNVESHRDQETVTFGTACRVHAIAHDGIFRFEVPKRAAEAEFVLTSSSRLDVAIRCSENADIMLGHQTVGTITVDATRKASSASPFISGTETWKSARLEYTKDMRQMRADNTWAVHIDETNINGISTHHHEPLCDDDGNDFTYGTVQAIILQGAKTHPFHIHMYPMQVAGSCGSGHDDGEFYDTIVTAGGSGHQACTMKLHLVDVAGPTTVHCHIFQHAEQGALGYFNVEGGPEVEDGGPSCMDGSACEGATPMPKCSDMDRRLLRRK